MEKPHPRTSAVKKPSILPSPVLSCHEEVAKARGGKEWPQVPGESQTSVLEGQHRALSAPRRPGPHQTGIRGIAESETRGTVWSPAQVVVGKLRSVFAQTNPVVKLSVLKFKS